MINATFITGNAGKAKYFSELVGHKVPHQGIDLEEIQSLDLKEVAIFKAKEAYRRLNSPVIVEDTALTVNAMGKLPGPYVKWFEMELGLEGFCRLVNVYDDRSAFVSNIHVYFDGRDAKVFEGRLDGRISEEPRGKTGFGFNPVFIPAHSEQTLAQMSDTDFKAAYLKMKPIRQVGEFLAALDRE